MIAICAVSALAAIALIIWAVYKKHHTGSERFSNQSQPQCSYEGYTGGYEGFVVQPQAYVPDLVNPEQAGYIRQLNQLQFDYGVPLTYADNRYTDPTPQPQYLSPVQYAYEGFDVPFNQAGVAELEEVAQQGGVLPFLARHDTGNFVSKNMNV